MSAVLPASIAQQCRRYRLLESAQLEELERRLPHFPDGRELIRELAHRGWLTSWQANQIVQGRASQLLLGSYVLLERLGEGGMGIVYKARNWKLGRIVAVKVIRKERLNNEVAVRRFHREIEAAAQLAHPHIVHAYDADEVDGTHLFVMEYVEGRDLSCVVKERGPLSIPEACTYIRQAALGLQHAFERGLVHRDIKPANLFLTRSDGVIKLLDMGLARLQNSVSEPVSVLTQEGVVMGTPDYIAPEQARDAHSADIRSDLYSLGCTLYFLLTAKVPFPGGSLTDKLLRHQMDAPPSIRALRPEVPEALDRVIDRLLAKQPEQRYQTPAELAVALEVVLGTPTAPSPIRAEPVHAIPVNPFADLDVRDADTINTGPTDPGATVPPPPSLWTRWPILAGAIGVLVIAVLALILLMIRARS